MKKLALGIVTAALLMSAAPAMAQVGFYVGPRGVGVGVPGPYYGSGCGPYNYPCNGYYDSYGGPSVVIGGGGWHGHGHYHGHHR
jgi:hypothetical protein